MISKGGCTLRYKSKKLGVQNLGPKLLHPFMDLTFRLKVGPKLES